MITAHRSLLQGIVLLATGGSLLAQGPPRGSSQGVVSHAPAATANPPAAYTATAGVAIGGGNVVGSSHTGHVGTSRPTAPNGAPIRLMSSNIGTLQNRIIGAPIVLPPALDRWAPNVLPTVEMWRQRDILGQIIAIARHGPIPIKPIQDETEIYDYAWIPAGWRGYGMVVPGHGEVRISLDHTKRGWFRLSMCNKWGQLEQGMLQNIMHVFEPVVTYKNPTDKARAIYIVADDPAWWSGKDWPYKLTVQRNWDPKLGAPEKLRLVDGIWAVHTPNQAPANIAAFLWTPDERERHLNASHR